MSAQPTPLAAPRFVRRTQLQPPEYRRNFRQIDNDIIAAVTSDEADRVTPLMSKIYFRLANAPADFFEREGVLRFEGDTRDGQHVTAWARLRELVGVANSTANKALRWLHEQGIIGYFAGKNGVGIRIFLNRAAASIGARPERKILSFAPAPNPAARVPPDGTTFKDSFGVLDNDPDQIDSRAPEGGAEHIESEITTDPKAHRRPPPTPALSPHDLRTIAAEMLALLRPWLEDKGLPKVARVAYAEGCKAQRAGAAARTRHTPRRGAADVTDARATASTPAGPLPDEEITEWASVCRTMREARGHAFDVTIAELRAGGCLSADDAARVLARLDEESRGEVPA